MVGLSCEWCKFVLFGFEVFYYYSYPEMVHQMGMVEDNTKY